MAKWKPLNDRDRFQQGVRDVEKKLNKEISKIRITSRKGLVKAGYHIAGISAARAPLYVGNRRQGGSLRGSVRVRKNHLEGEIASESNTNSLTDVVVVFEEKYAATQHEHVEFDHKEGEAKFLEKTVVEEQDRVLRIIGGVDNA